MRPVESVWYRNFLYNLQITKTRYDDAITRSTSGKKINELSDNPSDLAYVLTLRSKVAQIDQFNKNIETGLKYLSSAETAVNSTLTLMYRVISLAEQGASETSEGQPREIIADEIDEIRNSVLNYSNTQVMGKFIFAGSATDTQPFSLNAGTGQIDYNGNDDNVNIQADFSILIATNIPGNQVFGGSTAPVGVVDIFQRLADLRDHLNANDTIAISNDISTMNEIVNQLNEALGKIGNRVSHLNQIKGMLKDFQNALKEKMSTLEDADMAKAISDLSKEEVGLQSTLQVAARINKVSLMNYLG